MNKEQKNIVIYWLKIVFFVLVLFAVVVNPYINPQLGMLVIAGPVFIWFSLDKNVRRYQGYVNNSGGLNEFIEEKSKLKVWLVFCCAFVLPVIIYRLFTTEEHTWLLYGLSFGLLFAPVFIANEYDRYKKAGENT
ncbi:MAG: hypothetical protein P1U57_05065 [Oleibacter sp.]|nr:hypothetical protein [Thalassolituus sp.]